MAQSSLMLTTVHERSLARCKASSAPPGPASRGSAAIVLRTVPWSQDKVSAHLARLYPIRSVTTCTWPSSISPPHDGLGSGQAPTDGLLAPRARDKPLRSRGTRAHHGAAPFSFVSNNR